MIRFSGITAALSIAIAAPLALPADAQWLDYPTPGIPRTPDGKPNLSAPAPRLADGKPDLSGFWRIKQASSGETDKAMHSIKAQPWAESLSKKRQEDLSREDMGVLCLPFGPRANIAPDRIIQTPKMVVMLFEDLTYRQVFLDGRPLQKDPNPSWMGYSIGHWDGDTLVVESNGYNDRTWLDFEGHPHSEELRVTERWHRPDFGHLELERTLVDSKTLTAPWVIPIKLELYADSEMLEYVCAENERDHSHLVGKAADDKQKEVQVAEAVLKQYVGTYEYKPPDQPNDPVLVEVGMENGHLTMAMSGGQKIMPTALSETKFFYQGAQVEFVKDDQGKVTHLIAHIVEGDLKAVRK